MTGIIIALAMLGEVPCIGPNCPSTDRVALAYASVSPDTEVVQTVWVSNENRWGLGVIRGGRFVEAIPAAQSAPAPAPDSSVGAVGDVLNYGILKDSRSSIADQGYMRNDPKFKPPVHDPPNESPASGGLITTALIGTTIVLVLVGFVLLAMKGRG